MADVKWIKVSTGMFESNRKIKQIETMPEGDTILVIWLKLLLLAGNINDRGAIYITPEIPYTEEMLATELRRPITTVRMALKLFESFGMIEIIDSVYYLSAWEKYQSTDKLDEIREQNRKRVAKHREKKRLAKSNDTVTLQVTLGNALEEEGEEEKEKEGDFHSFTHAPVYTADKAMQRWGGSLGQGVLMISPEQWSDLCDRLSCDELDKYVEIVVNCELAGKQYKNKTHYQAILDMVAKDRQVAAT